MPCWRRGTVVTALAVSTILGACSRGAESASPSGPARRDSSGVEIVENARPRWAAGAGWAVADSPLVDVGGKAGDPAYDLAQVSGVLLLGQGRIAVAVGGAYQVRIYGPDGAHLATAGQRGSGPGEYQGIGGLWVSAGDSVLVSDLMQRRLTVISDSGGFGRTFALGGEAGVMMPQGGRVSFALPTGAFADGRVLALSQAFRVNDARQGAYRDSADYIVYAPGGAVADTVGRFPGIEMEQMTMSFAGRSFNAPSPVPLGRNTIAAVARDHFLVAKNDAWEIEVRAADGTLRRLIRLDSPPREITETDKAAHRQAQKDAIEDQPMLRGMPAQLKDQMMSRVENASYPKTFPFIVSILTAPDGTIWVHEQGTPGNETSVFAVLDSTGSFRGRVTFPEKFNPMSFGIDRVAGVWKDAEDMEHARVYGIRKP